MKVGERNELAAWFEDSHHLVKTLFLQRLRKRRPRQSRNDAVDRLDSGVVANTSHIGNRVVKQRYGGIPSFEHLGKPGIQLNRGKPCSRVQPTQDELSKHTR